MFSLRSRFNLLQGAVAAALTFVLWLGAVVTQPKFDGLPWYLQALFAACVLVVAWALCWGAWPFLLGRSAPASGDYVTRAELAAALNIVMASQSSDGHSSGGGGGGGGGAGGGGGGGGGRGGDGGSVYGPQSVVAHRDLNFSASYPDAVSDTARYLEITTTGEVNLAEGFVRLADTFASQEHGPLIHGIMAWEDTVGSKLGVSFNTSQFQDLIHELVAAGVVQPKEREWQFTVPQKEGPFTHFKPAFRKATTYVLTEHGNRVLMRLKAKPTASD